MEARSVEDDCRMFEEACSRVTARAPAVRREAEDWLQQFRKSPNALLVAKAVLERSPTPLVHFHATTLLRDVAMQSWTALAYEERHNMRNWILHFLVHEHHRLERFVRGQLIQTVAVMWKRGWTEEGEEGYERLFGDLRELLRMDLRHNIVAVRLLQSLVEEFTVEGDRATRVGQSVAFHRAAARAFEGKGLREVFALASELFQRLAPSLTRSMQALPPPVLDGLPPREMDEDELDLLGHTLSTLVACLSWDFGGKRLREAEAGGGHLNPMLAPVLVRPPVEWAEALLSPALVENAANLYTQLRFLWKMTMPQQLRELFTLLTSITGPIFRSPEERLAHGHRLLTVLFQLQRDSLERAATQAAGLPATVFSDGHPDYVELSGAVGRETLDLAQSFLRFAQTFTLEGLLAMPQFAEVMEGCSSLSVSLLVEADAVAANAEKATALGDEERLEGLEARQTWCMEGVDYMLEFWTCLAQQAEHVASREMGAGASAAAATATVATVPVLQPLRDATWSVYESLVQRRLSMAGAVIRSGRDDDDPFEDRSRLQDHMDASAVLGRLNPYNALSLLFSRLSASFAALQESISEANPTSPDLPLPAAVASEELFWLVLFAGHLLADSSEGEQPLVPAALNEISTQAGRAVGQGRKTGGVVEEGMESQDPVVAVTSAVFRVAEFELQRVMHNRTGTGVSPLLTSQLLWFMHRWSRSYLMPDLSLYRGMALSLTLTNCYGASPEGLGVAAQRERALEHRGGEGILDFLIQQAGLALSLWSSEPDLVDNAVQVLRGIVANRNAAVAAVGLDSWNTLMSAVGSAVTETPAPDDMLAGLRTLPREPLGQVVGVFVSATPRQPDERRRGYFLEIMAAVDSRLRALLDAPEWRQDPVPPGLTSALEGHLRVLSGLISSLRAVPPEWHLNITGPWVEAVAQIVDRFRGEGVVTRVALALVDTIVEVTLQFLPAGQAPPLLKAIAAVLESYAKHYRPKDAETTGASPARAELDEEETQDDLLSLLRILRHVADKDSLDLTDCPDQASQEEMDDLIAQVVVFGVKIVLPLMTESLLKFPDLVRAFISMIHHAVMVHEHHIADLRPPLFQRLLACLRFGITHHERDVAESSLNALFVLLDYHVTAVQESMGGPGAVTAGLQRQVQEEPQLLSSFIETVLSTAVDPHCPSSLHNPAANVILALAICEPEAYRIVVERLIASQNSPSFRQRLADGFTRLTSENGVQMDLSRLNRRRFQENFRQFVQDVRGFLIIR